MKSLIIFSLLFLPSSRILAQQIPYSDSLSEDWFALSKELIIRNEEQIMHEKNLSVFKEGHQRGYFYFIHPALPRYEPYLLFPEFEELARRDRQLYEKALEHSSTCYQVELPAGFSSEGSYPLFLIFHGGNSNFQRVRTHWMEEGLDKQFIKVYLQSYRHFDSESFTWRSGDLRADRDLLGIYEEILSTYSVDSTHLIVAGISAGASYAIGMALRDLLPVHGILAFCPGLPEVLRSGTKIENLRSDIIAYIVGGEHDFYLEAQHKLTGIFEKMGLEFCYRLVDGMGHQYPDSEAGYIKEGLFFIMKE